MMNKRPYKVVPYEGKDKATIGDTCWIMTDFVDGYVNEDGSINLKAVFAFYNSRPVVEVVQLCGNDKCIHPRHLAPKIYNKAARIIEEDGSIRVSLPRL